MPSNKDFTVSILVGGVELPEYEQEGQVYVESNLFTPVSYTQQSEELVQDEIEKQSWPVTPYQIKVTAAPNTPYSYYKIYVDGQKATQIAVKPSCSCISEGFYDGAHITEFLFSLPRFPQNKKDRMEKGKASKVGLIEVECWNSKVTGYKKPMINKLEYSQANKKDSTTVTNGDYMMATTKVGRSVRTTQKSTVEDWTLFNVRSRLTVKYVMGHSLIDMGFKLRPIRIPIHRIPASIVAQTLTSTSKRKRPGPKSSKKSPPPWKVTLTPPEEDVIAIDSDGSDDIIVGDFVPSDKKQKCDNSDEEGVMEISESDGQVPSTSEEKENGERKKDSDGNDASPKDEVGKKEEGDKTNEEEKSQNDDKSSEKGDKETKTDETEKESKDEDVEKVSKSSKESTTEDGDKDKTDTSDDKADGGNQSKEGKAEETMEHDEEKESEAGKEQSQDQNISTASEIKDEVIENVEDEGQSEAKNTEKNENDLEKDKETDGNEKDDDVDFIKEIAKFEPLESIVEDPPKTSSDGGEAERCNTEDTEMEVKEEMGGKGDGDSGVQGDGDKGDEDNGGKGDAEGCGDKESSEAVLDDMDCAMTVDPGGTFGDELILD